MGEDLTFENYLPKLGDARVFDPKWQKKYGYREWTYTHVPDLTATYDEKKARRDFDKKAQEKRAKYADGLHGYDYYSSAGSDVTEFQALKKRFEQSIPLDRWVIADSVTVKTADQDRQETFARLEKLQPPAFKNYDVTAHEKKALGTSSKKTMDKQLRDYKEMRANWEKSDKGQAWKKEVQRLSDMESGKLAPDPIDQMTISAPQFVERNAGTISGVSMDTSKAGKVNMDLDLDSYVENEDVMIRGFQSRPEMDAAAVLELNTRYNGADFLRDGMGQTAYSKDLSNSDGSVKLEGTIGSRLMLNLSRSLGQGMDKTAIRELFDKLMAPHRADLDRNDADAVKKADKAFMDGVRELKTIIFAHLKRLEATYGSLPTRMKADDFLRMAPKEVYDHFSFLQDAAILMKDAAGLFDYAGNAEDAKFKTLYEYYEHSWQSIRLFLQSEYFHKQAAGPSQNYQALSTVRAALLEKQQALRTSAQIGGPDLEGKEGADYDETVRRRKEGADKASMFLY